MPAPAVQLPGRDGQLQAFLCCAWILMLLGTLGGELRLVLHQGGVVFAVLLAIAFYLACFLTRSWLIDRAIFEPHVVRNGKPVKVKLVPALPASSDYVRQRAIELGIAGTVHVYYIPGTWNSVDAYVFGSASNQVVVLSGGLLALHVPGNRDRMDRFRFIVDHELGHIAGRDTDLLYLARATLIVGAALLALKCLLVTILGPHVVLLAYAEMFPYKFMSTGLLQSSYAFSSRASDTFVIVFYMFFVTFCFVVSAYFYVALSRRREELADQFAMTHSRDKARAQNAMAALLEGSALSSAPPHAFLGSDRWHPSAGQRLASIHSLQRETLSQRARVGMVMLTLLSIRFVLGDIQTPRDLLESDTSGMLVASAAYALTIGLILDLILRDGEQRDVPAELRRSVSQLAIITLWAAIVSAVLAFAAYMFVNIADPERPVLEGVEYLVDIETTERTWLILSMPLVVVAFGVGRLLLVPWLATAIGFRARALLNLASSTLAMLVLTAVAVVAMKPVSDYRAARFGDYWHGRIAALSTGKTAVERQRDKLLAEVKDEQLKQLLSSTAGTPFGMKRDVVGELAPLFPIEVKMIARRVAEPFVPPLSFIALWQAPLRSAEL